MNEQQSPPPIPKFDLHSTILFFWENWAVVKKHWVLFAATVVVWGLAVGYAVRQFDSRQIDILTTSNTQLRDHNNTLLQNAAIVPPSQWRRLSDETRASLISEIRIWGARPKAIAVYAVADSESRQFAAQFVDIFRSLNVETRPIEVALGFGSIDVGVMVGVPNLAEPSPQAREFFEILNRVGLKAHYTPWVKQNDEPNDFDIFIGPKPW